MASGDAATENENPMKTFLRIVPGLLVLAVPLLALGCVEGQHEPPHYPTRASHDSHDDAHVYARPPMPSHRPAHAVRGHWSWDAHRGEWTWEEDH